MSKKTPSAPAAPDPTATANAQAAANLDTAVAQAWLNATNRYSPYGNVTYKQEGTVDVNGKQVPRFSETVALSPEQQRQFDLTAALQEKALGYGGNILENVGKATSNPFSLAGLPQAPGIDDFSADRDKVTNAIIQRNQPLMQQDRNALENKLMNQGIAPGSEAWKNSMDDLTRQQNDFNLAAIGAGGQEQSRLFGLGSAARQNAIQERAYERSQPINEYATILGLGGNVQMPQFSGYSPPNLAGTDVIGPTNLQYQGQLAGYNAKNAANQATMGNLYGLGSALGSAAIMGAMMSDICYKENIRFVGHKNGLPIYEYNYIGNYQKWIGVLAQEIYLTRPDAIIFKEDGMLVDYNKLGIRMCAV